MQPKIRLLWVLPLLLALLGGCVGKTEGETRTVERVHLRGISSEAQPWATIERPLHSLKDIVPFATASADGTALRGHVYLPDGPGPFATVLELSPYWNTAAPYGPGESNVKTVDGRRTMGLWHQPFMDAGFAVALINMRGTGESDGCFVFGGRQDAADAYAVVEGLAKQPWSNGRVGMVGLSYPGWSQYLALVSQPPSLKAVIPSSGVIDVHSLVTRNGAALSSGWAVSPLWTVGTAFGAYALARTSGVNPNPFVPDTGPSHFACDRYAPDFLTNAELVWNGDRNAYWRERDYRAEIARSPIPLFFTNGLTTGEGHILQFEGLWDMIPTDQKRMMVGQHGHAYPTGLRPDFPQMQVAWLDHYLRDGPALVTPGIVEFQDDQKNWREADQWPPISTTKSLYISGNALVDDPQAVTASRRSFQAGTESPSLAQCHDHQVLYVSPPTTEEVLLAGNFYANFTLASNLPDGNLAVYLYQTKGPGTCPDGTAREVRRALTDLRHPTPAAPGRDFPLNTPTQVTLRSHPFASLVPAGSRLVLAIAGESSELTPDPRKPALTVLSTSEAPAEISLPVVDGRLVFG